MDHAPLPESYVQSLKDLLNGLPDLQDEAAIFARLDRASQLTLAEQVLRATQSETNLTNAELIMAIKLVFANWRERGQPLAHPEHYALLWPLICTLIVRHRLIQSRPPQSEAELRETLMRETFDGLRQKGTISVVRDDLDKTMIKLPGGVFFYCYRFDAANRHAFLNSVRAIQQRQRATDQANPIHRHVETVIDYGEFDEFAWYLSTGR